MTVQMHPGLLDEQALYYLSEGTNTSLFETLGAHVADRAPVRRASFGVWAPNASYVAVVGNFNSWTIEANPLVRDPATGLWSGAVEGLSPGELYKFYIAHYESGRNGFKSDPFAFSLQPSPGTASVLADLSFEWSDADWLARRAQSDWRSQPVSIYEVHLPSWRRGPDGRLLSYRDIARPLAAYVKEMGFSHVQFLPLCGSALSGSISFFAPAPSQGTPHDFMWLIDYLHQHDIGVNLTWNPTRAFQTDEQDLHLFDGSHLYEIPNEPFSFNYERPEVRSFLLSSARFWIERYHLDGLHVLGLEELARQNSGQQLLRDLNSFVSREFPGVQTFAKHYAEFSAMSRPVKTGGLGFSSVLDATWVRQSLHYLFQDPYFRRYHHYALTSRTEYASAENFILPLSYEEVQDGKGSLLAKMIGDDWQKFATVRLLFAYMWSLGGEKLLFMGGEFAQWSEWNPHGQLDWHALDAAPHAQMRLLVGFLNHLYRSEVALHELDSSPEGFQWINPHDEEKNVISFVRRSSSREMVLVVCNFSPIPRHNYRLGVPEAGHWLELLNTDAAEYGGSGVGNFGGLETVPVGLHGHYQSVTLTLPPLAAVYFKYSSRGPTGSQLQPKP